MILIFKTDKKFLHHPISATEAKKIMKNHIQGKPTYKLKVRAKAVENLIPDDLKLMFLRLNGKLPDEFLLLSTEKEGVNYFDLTVNELIYKTFNKDMLCGILCTSETPTLFAVLN